MKHIGVILLHVSIILASIRIFADTQPPCVCIMDYEQLLKQFFEFNCTYKIDYPNCCSYRFDCSNVKKRPKDKCLFAGVEYKVNKKLPSNLVPCSGDCTCKKKGGVMKFVCKNVPKCSTAPLAANCVALYERDKCCSTKTKCTPNSKSDFTCAYKNATYAVGQKWIPYDSHPCLECICQKGYNGSIIEPWCQSKTCGMELDYFTTFKKGCVPVYHNFDTCCPFKWRCPDSSDRAIEVPDAMKKRISGQVGDAFYFQQNASAGCRFGSLQMNYGQIIAPTMTQICVFCACYFSPQPVCVFIPACFSSSLLGGL